MLLNRRLINVFKLKCASGVNVLSVSIFEPDPVFFIRNSNKLTTAVWAGSSELLRPNPVGIASVLQFGAIIPPYSPWLDVDRAIPKGRSIPQDILSDLHDEVESCINLEQQSALVEKYVDRLLLQCLEGNKSPVLLFSGGVDSGFIASRLSALGRTDTTLVNFAFSKDDPETKVAESMAKELGLSFKRVYSRGTGLDCLTNPGKIWHQPFGDHSTVPTTEVALSVIDSISSHNAVIFDGTGADGALGMVEKIRKWKLVVGLPGFVNLAGAGAYKSLDLAFQSSPIEYYLRLLRRGAQFDLLSGLLAQNSLSGIAYKDTFRNQLIEALAQWIDSSLPGLNPTGRVIAADMALTCSNVFVQKARPLFVTAGFDVCYPFLDNKFAEVALKITDCWNIKEPKESLKYSLCKKVSSDLVYRPKSGFSAPASSIFHTEEFVSYLRCLLDNDSDLKTFLCNRFLIKACDHLHKGKPLPPQTLNFLWASVFSDRWYRTALRNI